VVAVSSGTGRPFGGDNSAVENNEEKKGFEDGFDMPIG
jgi:hypothetical protein